MSVCAAVHCYVARCVCVCAGFFNDDTSWDPEIDLTKRAVHHVNRLRPAFAIICGDLTNSLVELTPSVDAEIRTRQVADLKEVLSDVDERIPIVCVCGNRKDDNFASFVDRSLERLFL